MRIWKDEQDGEISNEKWKVMERKEEREKRERTDCKNHARSAELVPFPKMHSVWDVPKNSAHTHTRACAQTTPQGGLTVMNTETYTADKMQTHTYRLKTSCCLKLTKCHKLLAFWWQERKTRGYIERQKENRKSHT